jgi:DTW domain-containing protein YfiP
MHPRVNTLIHDPTYFPVLLYPGPEAFHTRDIAQKLQVKKQQLLVFIIDATWSQASKIMRLSRNLHQLPKVSFRTAYRSGFAIKRQPRSHCLATIESVYYLIYELINEGVIEKQVNPEGLMQIFQKMIDYQLFSYTKHHQAD